MQEACSDLFIIGGGINGASIAADAAGRGLSVTLCEKNDIASGTSSASSKLIHGGLRYLENYEFGLVRKELQEREILLRKAPHIISPLEFILPHGKNLRPAWLIQIGLFLYDHLAAHPHLPNSKKINLQHQPQGENLLPQFEIGFSYFDCFADDARLTLANALCAKEHGATILTKTTCLSADYENKRWKIQLKNNISNEPFICYATALVNASGPWIKETQSRLIHVENPLTVELIKGSHIVVPKIYSGNFAYILQNPDKRIVFTIPYENEFTLIGTTDVIFSGDLNCIDISDAETNYLCETIHRYFKNPITPQDIIWSYAGSRCLQAENVDAPSKISRDYKFDLLKEAALLTVISGKITTHRRLAEEAVEALRCFFPQMQSAWTANTPLPGGDIPDQDFSRFLKEIKMQYAWLPGNIAHRYAKNYGTRIHLLLQQATCLADLGQAFAAGLYQKEVEYLLQHEWANTSEDILWRRTKLGLYFSAQDVSALDEWLRKYSPKQ